MKTNILAGFQICISVPIALEKPLTQTVPRFIQDQHVVACLQSVKWNRKYFPGTKWAVKKP